MYKILVADDNHIGNSTDTPWTGRIAYANDAWAKAGMGPGGYVLSLVVSRDGPGVTNSVLLVATKLLGIGPNVSKPVLLSMDLASSTPLLLGGYTLRHGDSYVCQWTGSSLVQVVACRIKSDKPFPEPLLIY